MKNIFLSEGSNVVSLVKYFEYLQPQYAPYCLDYKSKRIKNITPCIKVDGEFFDLLTGKPVSVSENVLEWPVSVGTVFHYKNGKSLLISRSLSDRRLMLMEDFTFNPQSMVKYDVI